MKKILLSITVYIICHMGYGQGAKGHISIDYTQKGAEISPMYGVFFEEIGHAGEGGLYAELLRNRSFEDNTLVPGTSYKYGYMISDHLPNYDTFRYRRTGGYSDFGIKFDTSILQGWELISSGAIKTSVAQTTKNPLFSTAPHNIQLTITRTGNEGEVNLVNSGFSGQHYDLGGRPYRYSVYNDPEETAPFGIYLNKNEQYNVRIIARAARDYSGNITVRMLSANGNTIGQHVFQVKKKGDWQEYSCQLQPDQTVTNGKFSLSFDGAGTVWIDYSSLMPVHTFHDRANGLRKDVATLLADLKPAFIRWPGGCIVEGLTLENRFKWKATLGDPAGRSGEFDLWGYRNSYGFGYHEFLQYCEDIGASGMFVCNVGLSCLYRNGDYCSKEDIPLYIKDALDAIEYALGDVHTEWGAKRAAAGHPAPFPLKYIEVGNENRYQTYSDRYEMFYKAIKEKYPQLTIISDYGVREANEYASHGQKIEMIDPHWYERPDYFYTHHHLFDSVLPRPNYKLYVGEYSANIDVGGGTLEGALSEAAFATGMERNSDLVKMCSYAPLLQHIEDNTWAVNMIIFNTDSVYGRTSYYVQKMLSENRPAINLNTTFSDNAPNLRHYAIAGYDDKTNEIVIKVINGEASPFHCTLDVKNAGQLATDGMAIVLSAASDKEENSFSDPSRVSPRKEPVSAVSGTFDYEFKPFSFTVLRIKRLGEMASSTMSK